MSDRNSWSIDIDRYFLGLSLAALYCLLVYVLYTKLPPAYSVEVTLVPASYFHIEEDVTTRSRKVSKINMPSFDVAITSLEIFYRECESSLESTVRVLPATNQKLAAYKLVISDVSQDVSLDHVKCAIDLIIKEQDALRRLLVSSRKLSPPMGFENDTVSLIKVENLSDKSRLKALARAAILGLVTVVLLYAFGRFIFHARKSGLLGSGASKKKD